MRKNFYEIFEEVEAAKDTPTRINILRMNNTPALLDYFRYVYDPRIKFCVEEIPPYTPDTITPPGMSYTSIDQELKRAYLFIRNHPKRPPELSEKRVTELLIQVLENLEAKEAALFADMIQKKSPISRLLVEMAFPNSLA